jgi:HK97 family phage portal protein
MKILGYEIKKTPPPVEKKSRVLMQVRVVNGTPIVTLGNNKDEIVRDFYNKNPLVFAIVNWKVNKIKNCPFVLYRVKNERAAKQYKNLMNGPTDASLVKAMQIKSKAFDIVEDHKLLELLEKPSLSLSRQEFYSGECIYREMLGASYIYIDNTFTGGLTLDLIPSNYVMLEASASGLISSISIRDRADYKIRVEDMIITRRYNPDFQLNGAHLYGLGVGEVIKDIISRYDAGGKAQGETFANRGAKGIVTPKDSNFEAMDPDVLDMVERDLNAKLTKEGAGSVAVNSIPLDYIDLGMSLTDMELVEVMDSIRREVCACFGVSPIIFDFTKNSTFNNLSEAKKSSVLNGVIPMQEDLKDTLNEKLVPRFGTNLYLDYDYQSYPELQDDLDKQTDRLSKSYWLSINERRAEQDFPAITDPIADEILVPSNLTLLSDVGVDLAEPTVTQNPLEQ